MRRFTFIFSLLFVLCFASEANAQYEGYCSQQNTEWAIMLQTPQDEIDVTIWYADGTVLLETTVYTWDDRNPTTSNCVLRIGTANGGGAAPGDVAAHEQLITVQVHDRIGGATKRFSTAHCNTEFWDEVDDGFFCPPVIWAGGGSGDADTWIVIADGGIHLVPQGLTGQMGPGLSAMGIDDIISGYTMPYDLGRLCSAQVVTCPAGFEEYYAFFLTRQTGSPFTPNDHDFILGSWPVPEDETWYWHMYGNTLQAGTIQREIDGTLELANVTMTGQSPEQGVGSYPWGGFDITDTGTVRIAGEVTLDLPDFIDVEGSFQIPAGGDLTANGGTYRFAAGKSLRAYGNLAADDVTFTELNAGEGWYGVLYEPDAEGSLHGVTIEKFGYTQGGPGLIAPLVCGLTVNNRWKAVYRSTIRDGINGASGVCSFGNHAQISLRDENDIPTRVIDNDGHGLFAYSRGRIFLRGSNVSTNGGNGGLALGTRSIIYANESSSISGNGGVGLEARSNGNIYLYNPNTPSAPTGTTLDQNTGGGLLADGQGSYINAGTFLGGGVQGYCVAACENNILNHNLPGIPFDAKASGDGSLIFAEFDFWGDGRTQENDLELIEEGGMIEVLPIWDGMSSLRGGPTATRMAAEPSGFRDGVRGQIVEAMEKAAEGRWIPAFAQMQSAVAGAATGDDRQLVLGAATALLGLPDGPEVPSGLIQAIEAHMGQGQQGRPYALRTLLTAHRVRGHDGDARTMAQALIADFPLTEHALTGLAQEVELALEADDLIAAQVALATMEADFPDDLLTAATRAYFVLVAGEDALPERVAATPAVASSGVSNSAISAGVDGFALHAAYPNPFNPQTVVPFSVAATSRVRIVVFDMLGREVAVLVDGRVNTGLHTVSFDGSQLASGIYLLKATVRPETGSGMQTYTQRLTLLK